MIRRIPLLTLFLAGSVLADPTDTCSDLTGAASCTGRVLKAEGNKHPWNVARAAGFALTVTPLGKSKSLALWPSVSILGGKGEVLASGSNSAGEPATLDVCTPKGALSVLVRDVDPKHIETLKGGASYRLDLKAAPDKACFGGCDDLSDAMTCRDRAMENAGRTHDWKLAKGGAYAIVVEPTGASSTMKLWPAVAVLDDKGAVVAQAEGTAGAATTVDTCLAKGSYRIRVRDHAADHIEKVKGGLGYRLEIRPIEGGKCKK